MISEQYDVLIVGTGFAGIGAAIQLKRLGIENFVLVDREDDLGGTWHVNRYPGLAVDVPSTTYSYFFEPNPNWSRLFAPGPELKQYAVNIADKYDVRRHMQFNTTVESARWDDDAEVWRVAVSGDRTLSARYLITATGYLSQPRTPEIPGIETFAGKIIHTTAWDDEYDLKGKRVGIVGTGATAVQLIPELAKEVADLTVYQRTPIHAVPKFDPPIGDWLKRLFARVPATQRAIAAVTFVIYEYFLLYAVLHSRRLRRLGIAYADLSKIHRFVSIRDKKLRKQLTPDYDFGCKRPTFSTDYYRTFAKPHVHLQTSGIARIEPDGIRAEDGTKAAIDTLVLATGFDMWDANFPPFEIVGRDSRNLGKWWRDTRFQAYQGVTMPGFPNLMNLASPYSFIGLNYFATVEYQMRHMDRLFTEVNRRGATTFEVTEDANTRYLAEMDERMGDMLFVTGDCATSRSYYFDPHGEATLLRPMSTADAVKEASEFPLSDYRIA